jgi:hypothetical protein
VTHGTTSSSRSATPRPCPVRWLHARPKGHRGRAAGSR